MQLFLRILATILIVISTINVFSNDLAAEEKTVFVDYERWVAIQKPGSIPKKDNTGNTIDSECLDIKHSDRFQVGVGIPTFTFNMDSKKIGFLDASVDVMFGFRFAQKVWVDWSGNDDGTWKHTDHKISWWDISFGVIFNKPQDSDVNFGFMVMPWGMTFDNYSLALGASYVFPGEVEWDKKNLNINLAFTLNILQN